MKRSPLGSVCLFVVFSSIFVNLSENDILKKTLMLDKLKVYADLYITEGLNIFFHKRKTLNKRNQIYQHKGKPLTLLEVFFVERKLFLGYCVAISPILFIFSGSQNKKNNTISDFSCYSDQNLFYRDYNTKDISKKLSIRTTNS